MTKVDLLITKFKEFKEELNKNQNMSYGGESNSLSMAEAIKFEKNGQWNLDKAQVPGSKIPPAKDPKNLMAGKIPSKPAAPVPSVVKLPAPDAPYRRPRRS